MEPYQSKEEKRRQRWKIAFITGLIIWAISIMAFLATELSHPSDSYSIYDEGGGTEWINAPAPSDAPMTERENLIRDLDKRETQFLQGQAETPAEEDDYIP